MFGNSSFGQNEYGGETYRLRSFSYSENIKENDKRSSSIGKTILNNIRLSSSKIINMARSIIENMKLSDYFYNLKVLLKDLSESVIIISILKPFNIAKNFIENIRINDTSLKSIAINFVENIKVMGETIILQIKNLFENIVIHAVLDPFIIVKSFIESILSHDSIINSITRTLIENIRITANKTVLMAREINNNIRIVISDFKAIVHRILSLTENLNITSTFERFFDEVLFENIKTIGSFIKDSFRVFTENISIIGTNINNSIRMFIENVVVSGSILKAINKTFNEFIAIEQDFRAMMHGIIVGLWNTIKYTSTDLWNKIAHPTDDDWKKLK